jgi:FKBP-type peptidyl-prolyl cis-trans isomerase FkpA
MKLIQSLLVLSFLLSIAACNKGSNSAGSAKLDTEDDKTFYAMGVMLGSNLQRLSLNDQELNALYKGVMDAAKGKKPEVDLAIYQPKIQALFKARMEKVAEEQKKAGASFVENFLKEEGVKKTDSGLAYKVLKEGTGAKPGAEDTVEVHYHGTLTNGEVFDSSVERGKTISFPLNRVIKGWTEGLQLIGEGGKIKLVIPSELAYGEAGAPPKIPGGSTLVFEVELFKVSKTEEAPKPAPTPKKGPAPKKK